VRCEARKQGCRSSARHSPVRVQVAASCVQPIWALPFPPQPARTVISCIQNNRRYFARDLHCCDWAFHFSRAYRRHDITRLRPGVHNTQGILGCGKKIRASVSKRNHLRRIQQSTGKVLRRPAKTPKSALCSTATTGSDAKHHECNHTIS
jgi:hypothetical protein